MKIAAIVTTGRPDALLAVLALTAAQAAEGAQVSLFFRDESIPPLCEVSAAERLGWPEVVGGDQSQASDVRAALDQLASWDDVNLYACTSSTYVWGVAATDLRPGVKGRGLIAFLAEDLEGAEEVWCV